MELNVLSRLIHKSLKCDGWEDGLYVRKSASFPTIDLQKMREHYILLLGDGLKSAKKGFGRRTSADFFIKYKFDSQWKERILCKPTPSFQELLED
jgi:hypothetical protein